MAEPTRREYPPMYEKIVPVALTMIVIVVVILLGITVAVALRLVPGAL